MNNLHISITVDDEVYTVDEFIELIKDPQFKSYDGVAYYATDVAMSNHRVVLGEKIKSIENFVRRFTKTFPKYTHIVWVNK